MSVIPYELQAIAERIDTGNDDPGTSRALVVFHHFNHSDKPVSGTAVFSAAMAWPTAQPLPPIAVTEMDGSVVPSAITNYTEFPDKKERPEYRQVLFQLRFSVQDIPVKGWKTYLAAYVEQEPPTLTKLGGEHGLIVVETTRHGGDLPPVGNF